MIDQGWVKLHRKLLHSAVADSPDVGWAFIWFLLNANWERRQLFDGTYLDRGQLRTSLPKLAKAWNCSIKQVRRRQEILCELEMIQTKGGRNGTTITIVNYSLYQGLDSDEGQDKGRKRAGKGQEKGRKRAAEEEVKEIKKGRSKEKRAQFAKPTLLEIQAYWQEKSLNGSPIEFHAYYESNGWRVGRNPMRDWKAAARGWSARQKNYQNGPSTRKSAQAARREHNQAAATEFLERHKNGDTGNDNEGVSVVDGHLAERSIEFDS